MEVEAKFAIPNRKVYGQLTRVRELAGFSLVPAGHALVADRYLDTDDGRLQAAGYACRLRADEGAVIATLKGLGGAEGAVHRRLEEEVRLTAWSPDPTSWPESAARTLALELAGGAELRPLFDLNQRRARADLLDGDRRVGQLSLDRVWLDLTAPHRPVRSGSYHELEIELTPAGTEADLAVIAGELATVWGLLPESRSKFERGLALVQIQRAETAQFEAARPALEAHATGAEPELARRAAVLLAYADGLPMREAALRGGLSIGRARYWLRAFRAKQMAIFGAPKADSDHTARVDAHAAAGATTDASPQVPGTSEVPGTWGELLRADVSEAAGGQGTAQPAPAPAALLSVAAFCREHGVDMAHGRFVAAQARLLFDALRPVHGLPGKRRRLLKQAALLHTLAAAQDPKRSGEAGRDLILAQPLRGVSTADRLALACITAFNRDKVRPKREPTMNALDEQSRPQVLALTALLRVAEALDFSRTQTTEIQSLEGLDASRCEVVVSGPHAEMDALHATGRADFWYEQFQQELVFLPVAAGDRKIATAGERPADDAALAVITSAVTAETPAGAPPLTLPAPPLPEAQPLLSDEPMSEAGRKVIHFHFGRMLYHEPGTRLGEDPEALHDMRVATRRMRAAFQLFAPYYEAKTIKPLGRALRRTGRTLGAVRDLDVLLGKAHAHAASLPAEQADGLAPLLADWQARREVARRQMLDYLDSDDYRQFVSAFERFLTTPGAGAVAIPAGEPTPRQACHIVPQIILARFEQVRAFEPIVGSSAPGSADGAPVEMLHRLRIECKGLRYAMEFFRELLGPEAAGLIKQVVGVQDLLGELQDACVAESLIAEFLAQQRRKRRKQQEARLDGVEAYLAAQQAIQTAQIARFPEPWAALVGADFRRGLMLALAAV